MGSWKPARRPSGPTGCPGGRPPGAPSGPRLEKAFVLTPKTVGLAAPTSCVSDAGHPSDLSEPQSSHQ